MKNKEINDKFNAPFATQLRAALSLRQITQAELAKKTGISEQTISYYRNGERLPNTDILKKIAKELNVSADYLLKIDDSPSPDINVREMHNQLGLSEKSIEYLRSTTEFLKLITGGKDPDTATKIQQRYAPTPLLEYKSDINEIIDYAKKIGISLEGVDENSLKVLLQTTQSPIFKTIDELIENEMLDPMRRKVGFSNTSILGILRNIFNQENSNNEEQDALMKWEENGKQHMKILPIEMKERMFNFLLMELQTALINWRNNKKDNK